MIDGIDYMQDSLMWVMHVRAYRCEPEKCKLCDKAEPLCVVRFGRTPYLVHKCDLEGQPYTPYEDYLDKLATEGWECHLCGCDFPVYFYERDGGDGNADHRCNPGDENVYYVFLDGSILPHNEAMVRFGHPERQVNASSERRTK
jgi:hypothetical protein